VGGTGAKRLPDLRGTPGLPRSFLDSAAGHFIGSAHELQNYPIPSATFPKELRNSSLFVYNALQSIAQIEQLAHSNGARVEWPADTVLYYNVAVRDGIVKRIVNPDMALAGAHQAVPPQLFTGIVDAVRNRVLDLALELEAAAPQAGQQDASPETNERAAQVINNYNLYGVSNVAIASSNVTQTVQLPALGDVAGLLRYLGAAGVDPEELVALNGRFATTKRTTSATTSPVDGSGPVPGSARRAPTLLPTPWAARCSPLQPRSCRITSGLRSAGERRRLPGTRTR
jgi:AbiTii